MRFLQGSVLFGVSTVTLPFRVLYELSLYIFKNKEKSRKYGTGATFHQIQRDQIKAFIKELEESKKKKKKTIRNRN